jgi:hypothetical protein
MRFNMETQPKVFGIGNRAVCFEIMAATSIAKHLKENCHLYYGLWPLFFGKAAYRASMVALAGTGVRIGTEATVCLADVVCMGQPRNLVGAVAREGFLIPKAICASSLSLVKSTWESIFAIFPNFFTSFSLRLQSLGTLIHDDCNVSFELAESELRNKT